MQFKTIISFIATVALVQAVAIPPTGILGFTECSAAIDMALGGKQGDITDQTCIDCYENAIMDCLKLLGEDFGKDTKGTITCIKSSVKGCFTKAKTN